MCLSLSSQGLNTIDFFVIHTKCKLGPWPLHRNSVTRLLSLMALPPSQHVTSIVHHGKEGRVRTRLCSSMSPVSRLNIWPTQVSGSGKTREHTRASGSSKYMSAADGQAKHRVFNPQCVCPHLHIVIALLLYHVSSAVVCSAGI